MKISKFLSVAAAIAVAASTLSVVASAKFTGVQETDVNGDNDSVQFIAVQSNDFHTAVAPDKLDKVAGFTFKVTVKEKKDYESALGGGVAWFGGAVGANSPSTGWKQLATWGVGEGTEEIIWQPTDKRAVYTVTYQGKAPIFAADDTYALLWIQDYSTDKNFTYTISDVVLLDADGKDVLAGAAETPATPAEPEKPAETEAPVATEAPVETAEPADVEETVEVEETVDATVETVEVADETVEVADETVAAEDTAEAPADVEENKTPADENKGSPDTGVAGVAAVAGIAALAGAAVVASRKRK